MLCSFINNYINAHHPLWTHHNMLWTSSWFIISMGFMESVPTTSQTKRKPRTSSVLRMIDDVGVVIIPSYPRVHFQIISLRTAPPGSLMWTPTESALKRARKPAWKTRSGGGCVWKSVSSPKALSRLEVIGVFDSKVSSPQGWNIGAVLDKQNAVLL